MAPNVRLRARRKLGPRSFSLAFLMLVVTCASLACAVAAYWMRNRHIDQGVEYLSMHGYDVWYESQLSYTGELPPSPGRAYLERLNMRAKGQPVKVTARSARPADIVWIMNVTQQDVEHISWLSHVQTVLLSRASQLPADLSALGKLPRLADLEFFAAPLTNGHLSQLAEVPCLSTLDASKTLLDDQDPLVIPPGLTCLSVDDTSVGDRFVAALARTCRGLHTLDLSRTKVTDAAVDDLASMKSLRRLEIVETSISEQGVKRLKQELSEAEIFWTSRQ